jgi:hypothetical protein
LLSLASLLPPQLLALLLLLPLSLLSFAFLFLNSLPLLLFNSLLGCLARCLAAGCLGFRAIASARCDNGPA